MAKKNTGWRPGPLPPDTYNWGGVVAVGHDTRGFYFADFCGDHVTIVDAGSPNGVRVLKADEVAWFNNCLELPQSETRRAG